MKISPFSTTPGIAGEAYINIGIADAIIDSFDSPYSTQYVYKILGLRGSGKSVEYKKVLDYFAGSDGWKVYALSAGGNPTETLISALSRERIVYDYAETIETTVTGNIEGGIPFIKGGSEATRKHIVSRISPYSDEDELRMLCRALCHNGFKILIGIDDIAVTDEMIAFLSIIGTFLMDPAIEIRLITTGLQSNIERFNDVPHLSFFARPKAFVVQNLNLHDVKRMYKKLIDIDDDTAGRMAELSKGYAFGYQMLGDEFFGKKDGETIDDVLAGFDLRIAPTYDLLWNTLTPVEREVVKEVVFSESGKCGELAKKIKGFSQHRQNLIKKHIVNGNALGKLSVELPRFREYINGNYEMG